MKIRMILAVTLFAALTACSGTLQIGFEPSQTDTAAPAPTDTTQPSPTSTPQPPIVTVLPPVVTDVPPVNTAVNPPATLMVRIFLIAMEDNGQSGPLVGCGDSAIPVNVEIPYTQAVLRASLQQLLSLRDQYYGQSGLYNALYQSNLQVESISIAGGKATVSLTGSLMMGGECDSPRVQAQLEQTVLQFPTVTSVDIYINGKPLSEVLSLK